MSSLNQALGKGTLTYDDLRELATAGFRNIRNQVSVFGRGTPTKKQAWAGGRPRRLCADGRLLHRTKGFAKTERGGYAKRSRRSNTSRT